MTTPGNPFHDPFTTVRAPARTQEDSSGRPAASDGRGVQSAAEQKALRAASLAMVSKDLERMLRTRAAR